MKRLILTLSVLVFSMFAFAFNVNALEVKGDGKWHIVAYSELTAVGVRGNVTDCSSSSSDIEAKVTVSSGKNTCQVRSIKKLDSNINVTLNVTSSYSGQTSSSALSLDFAKFESSSSSSSSSSSKSGSSSSSSSSSTNGGKCGVFGDPTKPKYFAFYLQQVFNLIKFLGPVLVLLMSILDLVKVTAEQKQDGELKKLGIKTLKRLIYAAIIFILPTLINFLFNLIGLFGTCVS